MDTLFYLERMSSLNNSHKIGSQSPNFMVFQKNSTFNLFNQIFNNLFFFTAS